MVQRLVDSGHVRNEYTRQALLAVPRELFVDAPLKKVYSDTPLPIGSAQTVSAPHMVAMYTDNLNLKRGMVVLEIGTGSGYHAAVTACALKSLGGGVVHTVEIDRTLYEEARRNIERSCPPEMVFTHLGDGLSGLKEFAPFDAAYITAAVYEKPFEILNEVKEGGVVLYPFGLPNTVQSLIKAVRTGGGWAEGKIVDCLFVPVRRPWEGLPGFAPN
ncbi:MAG: class I SAM-dependent methyltransferase [Thermoprotei archaeon]